MRRSAASQRSRAVAMSPASAAMRASASRAKTSTWASSLRRASSRIATRRSSAPATPIRGVHRGQQALAERGLFSTAGGAVPRGRRFERRPRSCGLSERTQDAPEMHPGERRQAHVAGGFGLVDRELQGGRAGRRSRRPGTALVRGWTTWYASVCRKPRRRDVSAARPMWTTASSNRCWMRASSPSIASRRTWSHGSSTVSQPVLRPDRALRRCAPGRRPRSRPGRRRASSRPDPTAGPARRRARRCDRSAPSPAGTRRDATRRRRGSSSSAPAGRRRRSRRPARWRRRCGRGRARGDPSTLRSTPRAAGRWPGLGPAPRRRRRRVRPGSVARLGCRRGRPRPNRTR